jgi:hypothetical protein
VDYFHACEYVSQLAASLFGGGSDAAHQWAEDQRHTLRHEQGGVKKVIARAAQQKRRGGLKRTKKDFALALNYLKKYKDYMDYAERKKQGDPIGSGITEAGCKVNFNQRLKHSGMRWHRETGPPAPLPNAPNGARGAIFEKLWSRRDAILSFSPGGIALGELRSAVVCGRIVRSFMGCEHHVELCHVDYTGWTTKR